MIQTTMGESNAVDFRGLRLLGWGMTLLLVVLVGMMTWRTLWAIQEDRRLTLQAELDNGMVAVRALEEHAAQTFQDARRTLDRIAVLISDDERAMRGDSARIHRLIANHHLGESRYLKALQFVTLDGTGWVSSPDSPSHQANPVNQVDVSDRAHIRFLLDHPAHDDTVVGRPYVSGDDSQWVVPVARRVHARNGQPIGIISVDVRLSYFSELYARLAKDSNACVALIATDGFIIVRTPFEARYVDRNIASSPAFAQLGSMPAEGNFFDANFLDDELPRHYVFRKMSGMPMMVFYGRDSEGIFAPWQTRRDARVLFLYIGSAILLLLIGLTALFVNRLRRAREHLQATQEKFFGLFEHAPMPLLLIRYPDSRIMEANRAWSRELGFRRRDAIGRTTVEMNIWVDLEQRNQLIGLLLKDAYLPPVDVALRHKDGRILTFELSASEFQAGQQRLFVFTLHDVSREREAEHQIRELNQKLEQRVASRTAKLETANSELTKALESLNAMQGELIRSEKMAALGSLVAGVAHELNTPIGNSLTVATTIEAHTEKFALTIDKGALSRRQLQDFLAALREGSGILTRTLNRAAELVSSFKQVAVDQTGDSRRRFGLRQALEEIVITLAPMCRTTPYRLVLGEVADVELDSFPGALIQVINNFVNNSLLHGFEGRESGTMTLSANTAANTAATDAGMVELRFSDDGVGILEENLGKVFDPFYTTKLGSGGSGLGMHIVYNIVTDLLGGAIRLESPRGNGLTIVVRIPLRAPDGKPA